MKAVRIHQRGETEVLKLEEVATPVPQQGEVLIQVAVAGVNYADVGQRQGNYPNLAELPLTLGSEVAGTVVKSGPGVDPSLEGRRVVSLVDSGGYAEAVISVLGQDKNSPPDMQTVATRNIIAAMEKYGITRLLSLTGAGVDAPQDKPKLANHLIKFALKTLSGRVLRDGENSARAIQSSKLDWIIVRGPMLNEGPYTGKYRVGWVGVNTGARISRADLADFMLKQLTDNTYLRQMPMVSD